MVSEISSLQIIFYFKDILLAITLFIYLAGMPLGVYVSLMEPCLQ
jgi:hypothetical protein